MAGYYDNIDLNFDENGDYTIGSDGDIGDTSSDTILSTVVEVKSIIRSDTGDFEKYPAFAANLHDFVGKPNTRETAKQIEQRIKGTLILNKIAEPNDMSIRVVPVRHDALLIIISIKAISTPTNSVEEDGSVVIPFVFNLTQGGVFFEKKDTTPNYAFVK